MKKNLALCHYETSQGTDTIVFLTSETDQDKLPTITNKMLAEAGVVDPDVEGPDAKEDAIWYNLLPVEELPELPELLEPGDVKNPMKCVVAGNGADGTPTFCPVIVRCSDNEVDLGEHYDAAEVYASENDYEPMLVYDELDGPEWLFAQFEWDTVPIVEVGDYS